MLLFSEAEIFSSDYNVGTKKKIFLMKAKWAVTFWVIHAQFYRLLPFVFNFFASPLVVLFISHLSLFFPPVDSVRLRKSSARRGLRFFSFCVRRLRFFFLRILLDGFSPSFNARSLRCSLRISSEGVKFHRIQCSLPYYIRESWTSTITKSLVFFYFYFVYSV